MVGHRCYRNPMPYADAVAELRRVKGTQLDPNLVDIFLEVLEEERQEKAPARAIPVTNDSAGR